MDIKWTDEETEIIEERACFYTVKQIVYRLKIREYIRSTLAIQNKLRSLGYSVCPIFDNYNCCEIARVLYVHSSTVTAWMQRGWLKASWRSTKDYQVKSQDLKWFLTNPPKRIRKCIAVFDKDAVDYLGKNSLIYQ